MPDQTTTKPMIVTLYFHAYKAVSEWAKRGTVTPTNDEIPAIKGFLIERRRLSGGPKVAADMWWIELRDMLRARDDEGTAVMCIDSMERLADVDMADRKYLGTVTCPALYEIGMDRRDVSWSNGEFSIGTEAISYRNLVIRLSKCIDRNWVDGPFQSAIESAVRIFLVNIRTEIDD